MPALEILTSRIELEGRTIVDTISDNAAMGAMVLGGTHVRPDDVDLRWVAALLYRNGDDRGVRRRRVPCSTTRRRGVAWLANKLAQHGDRLEAGEIVLAGSFTRPMWVHPGDTVLADYGPGDDHMPLRLTPTFRDALARRRPARSPACGSARAARSSPRSAPAPGWTGCSSTWSTRPTGWSRCSRSCRPSPPTRSRRSCGCRPATSSRSSRCSTSGRRTSWCPWSRRPTRPAPPSRPCATRRAGARGVGSALARSARWNRVEGYLEDADEHVSLFVQIETVEGVDAAAEIAAVDGVDGVFVGPSDLAASMGLLGQQTHPDVVAAVQRTFEAVRATGTPVGVNAFDPDLARVATSTPAPSFVLVGADVTLLARGSEAARRRGSCRRPATPDPASRSPDLRPDRYGQA